MTARSDLTDSTPVRCIRVGEEWHSVEDADGELAPEVTVSEQCDGCGSTDPETGEQAPFVREGGVRYVCRQCGNVAPFGLRPAAVVVFP